MALLAALGTALWMAVRKGWVTKAMACVAGCTGRGGRNDNDPQNERYTVSESAHIYGADESSRKRNQGESAVVAAAVAKHWQHVGKVSGSPPEPHARHLGLIPAEYTGDRFNPLFYNAKLPRNHVDVSHADAFTMPRLDRDQCMNPEEHPATGYTDLIAPQSSRSAYGKLNIECEGALDVGGHAPTTENGGPPREEPTDGDDRLATTIKPCFQFDNNTTTTYNNNNEGT